MTDSAHPYSIGRRRLLRTTGVLAGSLVLGGLATGSVAADASNNPAMPGRVYADGRLFATRGLTDLPAPTAGNEHSFDVIYAFENGADGQHAVAEAAPGDQEFNGGRWAVTLVAWTIEEPPVLTSDDEVHMYLQQGALSVVDTGVRYFECPLVPIRG
jgi:hypothetical protein